MALIEIDGLPGFTVLKSRVDFPWQTGNVIIRWYIPLISSSFQVSDHPDHLRILRHRSDLAPALGAELLHLRGGGGAGAVVERCGKSMGSPWEIRHL